MLGLIFRREFFADVEEVYSMYTTETKRKMHPKDEIQKVT